MLESIDTSMVDWSRAQFALTACLPHLICPDRFCQTKSHKHCYTDDHDDHFYIFPCHAGKTSHRPVVKIDDIRIAGKCDAEVRDGGTDITDHDPTDHQQRHF